MAGQSLVGDLRASMEALAGMQQRLEICIVLISVLVVLGRIAAMVTGARNGLYATVNVFIFVVFLGCCGFLVVDEHRMTTVANAVLERVPGFSD